MKTRTIVLTITTDEQDNSFTIHGQAIGQSLVVENHTALDSTGINHLVATTVAHLFDSESYIVPEKVPVEI